MGNLLWATSVHCLGKLVRHGMRVPIGQAEQQLANSLILKLVTEIRKELPRETFASWEQSISFDTRKTWVTNWVMEFFRER